MKNDRMWIKIDGWEVNGNDQGKRKVEEESHSLEYSPYLFPLFQQQLGYLV